MSGDGTLTVVGTLAGIMDKGNDWHEIHVAVPGKQYPVKVSTKKQELVELARAAGPNVMEWIYTEVDSGNPNPHRPGSNFINRYFEGVAPVGASGPVSDSPATRAAPDTTGRAEAQEAVDWDAKERRDYRSRAWAQTISALTHTIKTDEPVADVYRRLYGLQRMIYRDIVRELDPDAFPDDDVPFA